MEEDLMGLIVVHTLGMGFVDSPFVGADENLMGQMEEDLMGLIVVHTLGMGFVDRPFVGAEEDLKFAHTFGNVD
jgi:hypothetical protein